MRLFIVLLVCLTTASALNWRKVVTHFNTEIFNAMDANADGELSIEEVSDYFSKYDGNTDSTIDYREFKSSIDKSDPLLIGNEELLYKLFDQDNDGHVTPDDIYDSFKVGDENNDNVLSYKEINNAVRATAQFAIVARKKHLI